MIASARDVVGPPIGAGITGRRAAGFANREFS